MSVLTCFAYRAARLGNPLAWRFRRLHAAGLLPQRNVDMFDRTQSTLALIDPELWTVIQNENRR